MHPIRLATVNARATLLRDGRAIDIATRSNGVLSHDPMAVISAWDTLVAWADTAVAHPDDPAEADVTLGCPVPTPGAIYGIGLNYTDHAAEANLPIPKQPMVFAKFPTCVAGPDDDIPLTSNRCDWEAELVVVIGRTAKNVPQTDAMAHIAGLCLGQDISDRRQQFADTPPQFSLGKSAPAFGPIGPEIISLDAFDDPNDIAISCRINGETTQSGRTKDMIFAISDLVSFLSRWCVLHPGDLIFTGTPAGVGSVMSPRRYLAKGDIIETEIQGIGTMINRCV